MLVVGAPLISLTSVLQAFRSLVSWWVSVMLSLVRTHYKPLNASIVKLHYLYLYVRKNILFHLLFYCVFSLPLSLNQYLYLHISNYHTFSLSNSLSSSLYLPFSLSNSLSFSLYLPFSLSLSLNHPLVFVSTVLSLLITLFLSIFPFFSLSLSLCVSLSLSLPVCVYRD